jgi:PAS domain S-box-containing protein
MPREVIQTLSPRENEILALATEGLTDTAIANRLGISEGTVGTYWGRIRTKLGPFPRTELVAIKIRADYREEVEAFERERDQLLDKLRRAEEAETIYEHIVDDADEGVFIIDDEGSLEHANPAALQIFGYSAEEIKGLRLPDLIPPRFREDHFEKHRQFVLSETRRLMNPHLSTFGLHRSGHEIAIEIMLSQIDRSGGSLTACFVRPRSI